MKKLINLIALVMLVSTNVLTSFSYAQEDVPELIPENEVEMVSEDTGESEKILESNEKTPENNEETPKNNEATPEINPEDKEELEQGKQEEELLENVLPDAQDDVKAPTIDENKIEDIEKVESDGVVQPMEGNTEKGEQEKNLEGDEIEEDSSLQKVEEPTIMEVISGTTATLLPGQEFNQIIKRLAGDSRATYKTSNSTIKQILYTGTIPSGVTTTGISTSDSEKEIIAWYDSGVIYYSTKAETIYMNEDSSYMFQGCSSLSELDLSNFDTSNVTNMKYLFYSLHLEELNLSGWDFSRLTHGFYMDALVYAKKINMQNTKFSGSMVGLFNHSYTLEEVNLSGADTSSVTDMSNMFANCSNLTSLNLNGWDTSNVKKMDLMFWGCNSLTKLDLSNFDTSSLTSMRYMFDGCKLEELDLSNFDTSNVTDITCVFCGLENLTKLNLSGWDFRKSGIRFNQRFGTTDSKSLKQLNMTNTKFKGSVTYAFGLLSALDEINLSGADMSQVTDMRQMFSDCKNLREIKGLDTWDTSNVNNMSQMFAGCGSLTGLDLSDWDTSNVTDMGYMFGGCSKLENLKLDTWNLSRNPNMGSFIDGTTFLKSISMSGWIIPENFQNKIGRNWGNPNNTIEEINVINWDLSNTKNLQGLFGDTKALKTIKGLDTWNTSGVENMSQMFQNCSNLTGLDLSSFDTSNTTNMYQIFGGCSKLEEINLSGWDFRSYSNASLMMNMTAGGIPSLTKLNMTNTKYTGSLSNAFGGLSKLEELKLDGADTRGVTNMSAMFNSCSNLTGLDLSNFDTSNVTNMGGMFYGCSKLEELNMSGWDFRKVTNMNSKSNGPFLAWSSFKKINLTNAKFSGNVFGTFNDLQELEEINLSGADVTAVTNMGHMFNGCRKLKEINLQGWDTSNVTDMNSMFYYCNSLKELDLSSFDTSKVTNMVYLFANCSSLENLNLNGWSFYKNPTVRDMFYGTDSLKRLSAKNWEIPISFTNRLGRERGLRKLEEIDVSNWNLAETKDLGGLFADSDKLKTIKGLDTWDTSGVTNMSQMFYGCSNLTGLDLSSFDTSNVTDMGSMFNGCSSLTGLDLSNFDTSNVSANNMQAMFYGCSSLEALNLNNWVIAGSSSTIGGMFGGANNLKKVSMRNWTIPESFTNVIGCRASQLCATGLESIDVSNWNLSKTKDLNGLFGDSKVKKIKGLDTWDTSGVQNMSQMFYNCNNLTGLDLSSFDTSNVTNMGQMFYGCSSLTGLDLSNFDTSNVINMGFGNGGIFRGCNKLEELNLSGWNFKGISNNQLMMYVMGGTPQSLKKLNMTNTKYTGSASYAFGGLTKLEELNLDGADTRGVTNMNAMFNGDSKLKYLDLSNFDTSNVTDMSAMFYNCSTLTGLNVRRFDTNKVTSMGAMFNGCSSLDELDLSNFDTSKVVTMGQMFYNTPNLKTIYASENFVTNALSGDTSSKDMFSGTTSVVGGNGTKFDSNYIDKTYAKIDKVGQTGYFTDKNAINVKFINTLNGTETTSTFAKGQKLNPPSVNGYHVAGGYLDEEMTQAIDLNKGVDTYTVIYVKYERNGSSGGGGGGGSSKKTDEDTHGSAEESQKNTQDDKNIENVIQNETKGSEESSNTPMDSLDKSSEGQEILSPSDSSFTKEQNDAYTFAKENGITTKDTIQSAQMDGKLTRIAMAKMLSQYAINVLGQTPDTSKTIKFKDVTDKRNADYDNGVTLAYQLGIMGQNMKNNKFRPNDEVTRAEFVTALSRLLYQTTDGEYKSTSKYYTPHMAKLYNEGIITKSDPKMKERRGYVMIMLMRSAK